MTRRADELLGQVHCQPEASVFQIEVELLRLALGDAVRAPAQDQFRRPAGNVFWQAEGLADLAHGAARAIARDHGRDSRARAPIGFIDPLDYFFASLMLEIHVYVRRLPALVADEALEQKALPHGVDGGDP